MKKIFLFVIATAGCIYGYCQSTDAVQNYINTYKELAINEEIRTGVPAAITLAQGILETEAGQSDLVKASNNHFGIKCKTDWTGATVYHDDDAKGECFRSYNNAEESYHDHSDFLKDRPNYAFLFQLDPTDYEGWAKGLKRAGYATSNVYGQMLIKLIVTNHLQDYTLLAIQRLQSGNTQPQLAANTTTDNNQPEQGILPPPAPAPPITVKAAQTTIETPTALYPPGIFEINQTKVVFAKAGTSLFALASNFKVAYPKLLEFNDMQQKEILDKNQLIYLAKKQKKGTTPYHVVLAGETLHDIAQTEGIRLENLTEYNHVSESEVLQTGTKIYLQSAATALSR
jgi:LysM repeat protein